MLNIKNHKKLGIMLLCIFALVCALGSWTAVFAPSQNATEIADAATVGKYYTGTYYNGLDESLTGDAFQDALAKLITSTHKTITSYSGLLDVYKKADVDSSGKMIQFYTGYTVSVPSGFNSGTNREHVWPQSLGGFGTSRGGADGHHVRPADTSLNSARGNKDFAEVPQTNNNKVASSGTANPCYATSDYFYPGEGYRGATARILMYVQTRWEAENNLRFVLGTGSSGSIGDIEDLMKWHLEEPPTAEEIARNEAVFKIQGNRNPFIDHPEYAEMIYCNDGENYNDELQACVERYGSYLEEQPAVEITSLSVSPSTETLTVGATTKLNVTAYPTGASKDVTWTSSNTNVATVNNGTITAVGAGTTTITATSTTNTAIKATATITVKAVSAIAITGAATKTTYTAGDKFNPAGLTVTATYTDGSTTILSNNSCQWLDSGSRAETLSEGTTSVICKYGSIEKTVSGITVAKATSKKITFTFGENGTEHNDGSSIGSGKSYSQDDYTLSLTNASYIYGSATDAKGNSALKVGTKSNTGSFSFTVPSDVTSVEIHVAQYKDNTTKISINGISYTVSSASNNGAYTAYKVDTTSTKTITFATEAGGVRCMIDKIVYVIAGNQGGGTDTPGGGNQGGNEGGDEVDQELIASFNAAVDAAQSATTMSEKFSAIKTALSLYNQMNSDEKALTTSAYANLEDVIDSYNNAAKVVNNESNKATENAIMLFAGTFSVLAFAAYFLLRR